VASAAREDAEAVGGERDPQKLAALKDHRIKASRNVIAKSL
jgi:hypothetical protein